MRRRMRLDTMGRDAFIAGMKRYQEQGVRVLIDGKEADDSLWDKVFEVRGDGSFYMGDYIFEEKPAPAMVLRTRQGVAIVRETPAPYGTRKKLREIRFDRVYHK